MRLQDRFLSLSIIRQGAWDHQMGFVVIHPSKEATMSLSRTAARLVGRRPMISRRLLTPLRWSTPHELLKAALESGFRLIPGNLSSTAGGAIRRRKRIPRQGHADLRREVNGRPPEPLLKMANES